jgi:hypothetical protein
MCCIITDSFVFILFCYIVALPTLFISLLEWRQNIFHLSCFYTQLQNYSFDSSLFVLLSTPVDVMSNSWVDWACTDWHPGYQLIYNYYKLLNPLESISALTLVIICPDSWHNLSKYGHNTIITHIFTPVEAYIVILGLVMTPN